MTPLSKAVRRVTVKPFFNHGADRDRLFVAALEPGDVLTLRPLGCRRAGAIVTIALVDIYRYGLLCRVNLQRLEKANAVRKQKRERRQARAWKRELAREIAQ